MQTTNNWGQTLHQITSSPWSDDGVDDDDDVDDNDDDDDVKGDKDNDNDEDDDVTQRYSLDV